MLDESFYSRQLYVLGHEAMFKMQSTDILISGLGGLGIEIAKNIILGGVKSVVLHDTQLVEYADLSSQFYLSETDIGKNRALQSLSHLNELNPYVKIECHTNELKKSDLDKFQIVVLTNSSFNEQMELGEYCHLNRIKLIVADTRGLFGKIFCDFGENFEIVDADGKERVSSDILSITNDEQAIVTTTEPHDFVDDDWIRFRNVDGMTEINGKEFQIIKLSPRTFSIGNTGSFSEHDSNGVADFIRKPKYIDFKSFRNAHLNPEYVITDYSKMDDFYTLHIAFEAIHEFSILNNNNPALPSEWCLNDAKQFIHIAKDIHQKRSTEQNDLNEGLLRLFSFISKGNLCPIQSIIGSITAQEIIKASSGKYEPIQQFLYYDARECLPAVVIDNLNTNENEWLSDVTEQDLKQIDRRYVSQAIVFGSNFQKNLSKLNCFLVGCGALGCEYLKNFAMMGMSTQDGGRITVTDMDMIEKSNLNRQFLFKNNDIQKAKSIVAAKAIRQLNPSINIDAHINQIGDESELNCYNDEFFLNLDLVCNALDNNETRNYMDKKCVFYKKPLIESGTMGTEGKVQVILPNLTKSYRSNDASDSGTGDESIPACTIKLFPTKIHHAIQWSKDVFAQYFTLLPNILTSFLSKPYEFIDKINEANKDDALMVYENLDFILNVDKSTYSDCVMWALDKFYLNFNANIRKITIQYPIDYVSENGSLVWNNQKHYPSLVEFDVQNEIHLGFVKSTARLIASVFNINDNGDDIQHIIKMKPLVRREDVNDIEKLKLRLKAIIDDQNNNNLNLNDKERQLLNLLDFDKDTELHMDFVSTCSNLRARNYNIDCIDKHKCKLIAGRIIPAIATTTSLIVGLNCIELYKIVQNHQNLEYYKNSYIDLASPCFGFESSTPQKPHKLKYSDRDYTIWDYFEIQREMTLHELLENFLNQHQLTVSTIGFDKCIVYHYKRVNSNHLNLKIFEIIELLTRKQLSPSMRILELMATCIDSNKKIFQIPNIKYFFSS